MLNQNQECPIEAEFFDNCGSSIPSIYRLFDEKDRSWEYGITNEEFYRDTYGEVQALLNEWWNTLTEQEKRTHMVKKINSLEYTIRECNSQIESYGHLCEESLDRENSLNNHSE